MRVARNTGDRKDKEVEEHNTTYLPHCAWCPKCVKARGTGQESAWKKREPGRLDGLQVTMTVGKEEETTGCDAAHVCEQKGSADHCVIERVCHNVDLFGHTGVLTGDGEPALVQVQSAIKESKPFSRIHQQTLLKPMGRCSCNDNSFEPALECHCTDGLEGAGVDGRVVDGDNQCLVDHDWETPYARSMGNSSSKKIVEFGDSPNPERSRHYPETGAHEPVEGRHLDRHYESIPMNTSLYARADVLQSGVAGSRGGPLQTDGAPKILRRLGHHSGSHTPRVQRETNRRGEERHPRHGRRRGREHDAARDARTRRNSGR